jgi:hypothetical protein
MVLSRPPRRGLSTLLLVAAAAGSGAAAAAMPAEGWHPLAVLASLLPLQCAGLVWLVGRRR